MKERERPIRNPVVDRFLQQFLVYRPLELPFQPQDRLLLQERYDALDPQARTETVHALLLGITTHPRWRERASDIVCQFASEGHVPAGVYLQALRDMPSDASAETIATMINLAPQIITRRTENKLFGTAIDQIMELQSGDGRLLKEVLQVKRKIRDEIELCAKTRSPALFFEATTLSQEEMRDRVRAELPELWNTYHLLPMQLARYYRSSVHFIRSQVAWLKENGIAMEDRDQNVKKLSFEKKTAMISQLSKRFTRVEVARTIGVHLFIVDQYWPREQ